MKGIIEYLKKEVERGNVKLVGTSEDLIIYDEESKEFMIFDFNDIAKIGSLDIETELKEIIEKKVNPNPTKYK